MPRAACLLLSLVSASCLVASGKVEIILEDLPESQQSTFEFLEVTVVAASDTNGQDVVCEGFLDGSLRTDAPSLRIESTQLFRPAQEAPSTIGHLGEGRHLFVVMATDPLCAVVARGCSDVTLRSGDDRTVPVRLATPMGNLHCGEQMACVEGRCRPCENDGDCDDGIACTTEQCDAGQCNRAQVSPIPDRKCGAALDHDCDGIVDDRQGCGACQNPIGLERVHTIETAAAQIAIIGPKPSGVGSSELYVATPATLEVYEISDSGSASLLGSSDHESITPFKPVVMSNHVIVGGSGRAGLFLFDRGALRTGGAEPIATVGEGFGALNGLGANVQTAFISTAFTLGTIDLRWLPFLPEPITLATSDWLGAQQFEANLDVFLSVALRSLSFGILAQGREVLETGVHSVTSGLGFDVAFHGEDNVLLARGTSGLHRIPLDVYITPSDGEWIPARATRISFPTDCHLSDNDIECHQLQSVEPVGDRAAVFTSALPGSATEFTMVHLANFDNDGAGELLESHVLSEQDAETTEIAVAGDFVYVAARPYNPAGSLGAGAVDIYRIVCAD